ncbi:hypothetical protein ABIB39_002353 [Mucilaginibacter sp. UYP27]|uniref:hypothetical protein n=1 Tax=Mucilaginibacter sp. UYP27 TaxID=1756391 RepID=UPI00339AC497
MNISLFLLAVFLETGIASGSNGIFLLNQSFFQAKRVKSAAKIKPGLVVGFAKDFRHNSLVRSALPQPSALIPKSWKP